MAVIYVTFQSTETKTVWTISKISLRKLGRFEESEVVLDDKQNEEIRAIVEAVQPEKLEKLFQEGNQHNVGNLMKNIWYTDKDRQGKEFAQDQLQNGKWLLFVAFLYRKTGYFH